MSSLALIGTIGIQTIPYYKVKKKHLNVKIAIFYNYILPLVEFSAFLIVFDNF